MERDVKLISRYYKTQILKSVTLNTPVKTQTLKTYSNSQQSYQNSYRKRNLSFLLPLYSHSRTRLHFHFGGLYVEIRVPTLLKVYSSRNKATNCRYWLKAARIQNWVYPSTPMQNVQYACGQRCGFYFRYITPAICSLIWFPPKARQ